MQNITLISIIFLLTVSCKKQTNEKCNSGPISYKSLNSEYGCMPTVNEINITGAKFIIIKNQTEYNNTVTGVCQPDIDFNKYDLVIGVKQFPNGIGVITYEVSRNCQNNTIVINGFVPNVGTDDAPKIIYSCLLPKLQANESIEVNFIVH